MKQHGYTLVEVMVALAISLGVVALAWQHLHLSRQMWQQVFPALEQHNQTRLLHDTLSRWLLASHQVQGWTQAWYTRPTTPDPRASFQHLSRLATCTPRSHPNCQSDNDIIALRSLLPQALCDGETRPAGTWHVLYTKVDERGVAVLYCSYPTATGYWVSTPVQDGVISMQWQYATPNAQGTYTWQSAAHLSDADWAKVQALRLRAVLQESNQTPSATFIQTYILRPTEVTP